MWAQCAHIPARMRRIFTFVCMPPHVDNAVDDDNDDDANRPMPTTTRPRASLPATRHTSVQRTMQPFYTSYITNCTKTRKRTGASVYILVICIIWADRMEARGDRASLCALLRLQSRNYLHRLFLFTMAPTTSTRPSTMRSSKRSDDGEKLLPNSAFTVFGRCFGWRRPFGSEVRSVVRGRRGVWLVVLSPGLPCAALGRWHFRWYVTTAAHISALCACRECRVPAP